MDDMVHVFMSPCAIYHSMHSVHTMEKCMLTVSCISKMQIGHYFRAYKCQYNFTYIQIVEGVRNRTFF